MLQSCFCLTLDSGTRAYHSSCTSRWLWQRLRRGRRIHKMDADSSIARSWAFGLWYDHPNLSASPAFHSEVLSSVLTNQNRSLGLVRSPFLTTLMQVSSRFLLVWAVIDRYPSSTASSPFYSFMLLAWSITEVIRYSYFVWNLQGIGVPGVVTWLRYNAFYVLYPIGISSECMLVWKASIVADRPLDWVFWGILGVYVPG